MAHLLSNCSISEVSIISDGDGDDDNDDEDGCGGGSGGSRRLRFKWKSMVSNDSIDADDDVPFLRR